MSTAGDGTTPDTTWRIPPALDGERVDRTVALLTGLTRSRAASLVDEGRVSIGRSPVRTGSRRVRNGDRLRIDGALPVEEVERPEDLPDPSVAVPVLHADEAVIVVDKPAGLVVHPGAGHRRGTLVQGLAAAYPDLVGLAAAADGDGALRPGIVHRLDRGTSGLMVVARTAAATASLVGQLSARSVERRYQALAARAVGPDEGLIDAPLGRSASDPTRRAVRADGREARTRYQVTARFEHPDPATLLRCRLETGRTHQVRVHLAAIGHPLVGDVRYGGPPGANDPAVAPGPAGGGERPWLHAEVLAFDHPVSGERLRYQSPLPPDLVTILERYS